MSLISNEFLTVKFDLYGAIESVVDKVDNEELMIENCENIWSRHDMVLFPFVGRQKDGYYYVNGNKYETQIHGVAPYKRWIVENVTEDSITMYIESDSETLKTYPYNFKLSINYKLKNNSLIVSYRVTNTGNQDMYFYLGSHPAIKLDVTEGEEDDISSNVIDFNSDFNSTYTLVNNFIAPPVPIEKRFNLTKDLFKKFPSLVIERKDETVTIERGCGKKINIISDSPIICLWSDDKKGGFIAVESWWGLPDFWDDTQRELKNKSHINILAPNMEFKCKYVLEFINNNRR